MIPPNKARYWMSFVASGCALTAGLVTFLAASIPGGILWLVVSGLFALNAHLSKPSP